MNKNNEKDYLKNLFRQLPEEPLPFDFRTTMMQRVMAETTRVKKRNERLGLMAVILAALAMIGLCIAAIIYMEVPRISLSIQAVASAPFYIYIGILALLLLWGDYVMRKRYREKHKE